MEKPQKKYNLTLLYIEDEDPIRQNAVEFLQDDFLQIYEAREGNAGLALYQEKRPDIIITDIKMPKLNGLELCSIIRKTDDTTPIIITTAFTSQEYLLKAVELNLIKYLIKPIKEELLLNALKLCAKRVDKSIIKLTKSHYFDTFNKTLFCEDRLVKLSAGELSFLTLLLQHKNRVVTYKEIENYVWDGEYMSEDALKSLVKNLRKKISKESIQNHAKLGYKVEIFHG